MAEQATSRTLSEFASSMGWNWVPGLLQPLARISQRFQRYDSLVDGCPRVPATLLPYAGCPRGDPGLLELANAFSVIRYFAGFNTSVVLVAVSIAASLNGNARGVTARQSAS